MNYIDLIIIVFLIIGFVRGIMVGMVKQIFSLGGFIIAIFASSSLARPIQHILTTLSDGNTSEWILRSLSYLLAFLGIITVCEICGRLLRKVVNWACLGSADKFFGILFYEIKIILLFSVIINIYEIVDERHRLVGEENIKNSYFYRPVARTIPIIVSWVTKEIDFKGEQ